MTKLKTLKDLEGMIGSMDCHRLYNSIKAEAIKWVKHCEKNYKNSRYDQIFREFFNITEEDLKEEDLI